MSVGPDRENSYQFVCKTGCTKCCEQPGFVYLTEADLKRIATFLGMSVESFETKYVYRTKSLIRLRIPRLAQCPFLTVEGCSIHAVKPVQCSSFPFWPELLKSGKAWRETVKLCPALKQGPLVSIENARALGPQP